MESELYLDATLSSNIKMEELEMKIKTAKETRKESEAVIKNIATSIIEKIFLEIEKNVAEGKRNAICVNSVNSRDQAIALNKIITKGLVEFGYSVFAECDTHYLTYRIYW